MTNPDDLEDLACQVGRLYPAVYRLFHISRQPLPGQEITPRMAGVLHHLGASGPLTLTELTQHLGLGKATVTELTDRLEARGLVSRIRDDRDKRRVFLWLTEQGQELAQAQPEVLENQKLLDALRRMKKEERTALVQGLSALVQNSQEEKP